MNIDDYISDCWEKGDDYLRGVKDETIKVSKWIKKAVERYEKDLEREDLVYDTTKIEKVFKFFYFLRINIDNKYQRFNLLPFQVFILISLFGFYYKSGKRRIRYVLLMMGRKNGKSVFSAALQLYFLVADGVEDPQSLLLASTREQANICLEYATGIINHSPALRKRLEAQRYKIIFKDKLKGGFSKVLASNAHRLDGYSTSAAILDETHAYPDDKLFNVIKSSILARENPMIFLITTAGFSLTSFCYNYMLYAQNVLNGDIEDDSLFAAIFTLDEGDDYKDNNNWVKANPSIGEICHVEDIVTEYNQSKYSVSGLNSFLTKHMNIFVDQESAWIPNELLRDLFVDKLDETQFYGLDCYIGLDLSATRDLTALVCLFKKDDKYYTIPYFFMANDADKFLRSGGVNLQEWIKNGDIILCESPTIDYDLVLKKFKELKSKFNIRQVAYDPSNIVAILKDLYDLRIPTAPFEQRAQRFNEPLKALEKVIFDKDITLSNPALKWNINNVVLYKDGNGNIKIMKNKSLDSVDGAVALGMSMGAYQEMNQIKKLHKDVFLNK